MQLNSNDPRILYTIENHNIEVNEGGGIFKTFSEIVAQALTSKHVSIVEGEVVGTQQVRNMCNRINTWLTLLDECKDCLSIVDVPVTLTDSTDDFMKENIANIFVAPGIVDLPSDLVSFTGTVEEFGKTFLRRMLEHHAELAPLFYEEVYFDVTNNDVCENEILYAIGLYLDHKYINNVWLPKKRKASNDLLKNWTNKF